MSDQRTWITPTAELVVPPTGWVGRFPADLELTPVLQRRSQLGERPVRCFDRIGRRLRGGGVRRQHQVVDDPTGVGGGRARCARDESRTCTRRLAVLVDPCVDDGNGCIPLDHEAEPLSQRAVRRADRVDELGIVALERRRHRRVAVGRRAGGHDVGGEVCAEDPGELGPEPFDVLPIDA